MANSDLSLKASSEKIILFQPQTTVKEGANFRTTKAFMQRAYKDAVSLNGLVHFCSLLCDTSKDDLGGSYSLGPHCGGMLELRRTSSVELLKGHLVETEIALTCSNPACSIAVTSTEFRSRQDFSDLVLHLMIKQMVPDLPVGCYVDCNMKTYHPGTGENELRKLQEPGLIAVASDILLGTVGHFSPNIDLFSLGFMLTPGMKTYDGCGGYDEWLKFLVIKKFENLQYHYRYLAPSLLGPKLPRDI